jgi:ArsR family transcriptional regulator, virulence genes transcriptional regulator
MNLRELQTKAGAAEALLKALANRNRLVILCELLRGERSVSALQGAVGLSQSALSQHLARLREDELVTTRRESQAIYYSIASDRVSRLIGLLYELYCAPAREATTKQPARGAEGRRTL